MNITALDQRFNPPRLPVILVGLLLYWAYLRGFAVHMEPYGLGQYLYTYEEGFLIRGLLGTLFSYLNGPEYLALRATVEEFSSWFYLLFLIVLILSFLKIRSLYDPKDKEGQRGFANLLFLVLLTGPLLVGIGATRGFFDTYILTLALLAYLAFVNQRHLLAFMLVTLASLIHEQVAFTVLPMMGWVMWNRSIVEPARGHTNPTLLRDAGLLLALVVVILIVVQAGKGSSDQQLLIIDKVTAALDTYYLEKWNDPYFTVFAAHNDVVLNFRWDNFRRLAYHSHQTMLIPSVMFLVIGVSALAMARRWASALLFILVTLMPVSVLFFAMDAHRYLFHIQLTGFFLLLEALRVSTPAIPNLRKIFTPALMILGLWQFSVINYKVVEYNARNHVPLYELMSYHLGKDSTPPSLVWQKHI